MSLVIPSKGRTLDSSSSDPGIDPDSNLVQLDDGRSVSYKQLIVCPGLRLAWEQIEGLEETLGKNAVTSNYRYDLRRFIPGCWCGISRAARRSSRSLPCPSNAPVRRRKQCIFHAINGCGAGRLSNMNVEFNTGAAPVLFGVAAFVPPLMEYVKRYNADLIFNSNLVKVDGENRTSLISISGVPAEKLNGSRNLLTCCMSCRRK